MQTWAHGVVQILLPDQLSPVWSCWIQSISLRSSLQWSYILTGKTGISRLIPNPVGETPLWPGHFLSPFSFLSTRMGSWSTSSSSNEVRVQLRCSCLLCCESHSVIDVIPWSFFTAASNILLFMRACFHLLCASICVHMCANIDCANTSGGFVFVQYVYVHIQISVCASSSVHPF